MTDDEAAVQSFYDAIRDFGDDTEAAHAAGDKFVEEVLRTNGFPLLAKAYYEETNGWWYA